MKKTILYLAAVSLMILAGTKTLNAQDKKYPTPDIAAKPYYYDEKNNEAADMETGDLEEKTRTRGYGGIGTKESVWFIPGEKSIVRITKKPKLNFLVKFTDNSAASHDVNKMFILLKLAYNPKTKARELITMKQSSWSEKTEENYETIRFTSQKVLEVKDEGGYGVELLVRMLTVENLEPGEYVWMTGGWDGRAALFFGVD